jgi:hypothetical protein
VLVDDPNTLLVFSKRDKVPRGRVIIEPEDNEVDANINDSP